MTFAHGLTRLGCAVEDDEDNNWYSRNVEVMVLSVCTARMFRGVDDIETLRSQWGEGNRHPNSDFAHYLLVSQSMPKVIAPLAMGIQDANGWRGFVAGRLEQDSIQPRIGYARMIKFPARILTVIYQGILGNSDDVEAAQAVVEGMDGILAQGEADVVVFNLLAEGHPIRDALEGRSGRVHGLRNPEWAVHRTLSLQGGPGVLLQTMRSKHRSWIKRKTKELEAAYRSQIAWRWVKPEGDIDELAEKLEVIARVTYQRGLGAGFHNDALSRKRMSLAARRGQLRVMLLEINHQPKAFWLGEIYGDAFFSSSTGYTSDMRVFEVGTQMFLRMTDELIREDVKRLDFGFGDAQYKERFGDGYWREATVYLFAPTTKGYLLLNYLNLCAMSDRLIRNAVRKLGLFGSIKQVWRRRLSSASETPHESRIADQSDVTP